MKFFKKKMLLLAFLLCSISPAAVDAGCVICDGDNNDGRCSGERIRLCLTPDATNFLDPPCKIGVTNTDDCPTIGF